MNTYDIGDVVQIFNTFTQGGVGIDPSTVTLAVLKPDATQLAFTYNPGTIVRENQGTYHQDVPATIPGIHRWRWAGTGAVGVSAEEGSYEVRARQVP